MNLARYIGGQYRRPGGILGQIAGNRMAQQHAPENAWTVTLLNVQPIDHILEIGFGPGIAIQRAAVLTTRGYVAGIDFSRAMVRAASRRNAAALKTGRVNLRYGEAARLPFADNAFDKAFSIHSLYFWPDPLRALTEARRVLKAGGMLALTFLPREKWPGADDGGEYCKVYSGDDVIQLLLNAGFSSAHIEHGPVPAQFRELAVIGIK